LNQPSTEHKLGDAALNPERSTLGRAEIASALTMGTIALLVIGLQPILLGAMVEMHSASLEGVGIIAMAEIVALGLGVVLGDALLPLPRLRIIAIMAALFVSAIDVATIFANGDVKLAVVRSVAGLGEGVLVWVTTCVIVRSQAPDRIAGIFLVMQTLAQAAVAAMLAGIIVPRAGWHGGFIALAAISLLPCIIAVWLPAGVPPLAAQSFDKFRWSMTAALPPTIALLQMAAIGALWAYLELLGKRAGFDVRTAQAMTSAVLVMQVLGGTSASLLVRRVGILAALIVTGLVLGAIPFAMHVLSPGATTRFAVLCAAFGFAWLFLMPFHVSLAFLADPTGRVAMLIPAMQLLGSAIGPLVASLLVSGNDVGSVPTVSLGFATVAVVLLIFGRARFRFSGEIGRNALAEE